jgi:hypothetical protein
MASDELNIFKEEDLEVLIKHSLVGKNYNLEKVTKRTFLELANTFIQEVLDLPPSEKINITKEALERQISLKFPEVSREAPNV